MERQGGGVLLLVGVGLPSFLLLLGGGKEGGEGEGKGGAAPLSLSNSDQRGRGAWPALGQPSLYPLRLIRPTISPGGSGNPPALRFSPRPPGTLPVSEYSHPIYRSLRLDHFETPLHVCDHIRDSELPSVHQNTKLIIPIVTTL